jgi:hypothetical protein
MKARLSFVIFAIILVVTALATHAEAATLPDACGADEIKFVVKTQKGDPPAAPAEGKAQIVFVEMSTRSGRWSPFGNGTEFTTRFGLDGTWVGASANKSYFTVEVLPGLHHLCSSVQGKDNMVGATSLTTEAGKIYYYQATIENLVDGQGFNHYSFAFAKLDEDEGKFRVKALDLATSATKH